MQSQFEYFAVTSMMGAPDRPPREDGTLKFSCEWERTAFGVALALSRDGLFEWEDFRQHLIATIGAWEERHETDDPSWNYYDQWLAALEAMVVSSGLISREEITRRAIERAHVCSQ
jgi:nitrile hydratase accessory protein